MAAANISALLSGATGLLSNAQQSSQINIPTEYQSNLRSLGYMGNMQYNNYDQLMSGYGYLDSSYMPAPTYEGIRGMNPAQQAGSILSATANGAATMAQFGPWGALAGGIFGTAIGAGGVVNGNQAAQNELKYNQTLGDIAYNDYNQRMVQNSERIAGINYRNSAVRALSEGGKIERKSLTMKDFADRVMNARKKNHATHSAGIIREHCKGGTMVRIKMK